MRSKLISASPCSTLDRFQIDTMGGRRETMPASRYAQERAAINALVRILKDLNLPCVLPRLVLGKHKNVAPCWTPERSEAIVRAVVDAVYAVGGCHQATEQGLSARAHAPRLERTRGAPC
jgi:hypothetical protein